MELLTEQAIREACASLNKNWTHKQGVLELVCSFAHFAEGLAFVNRVGAMAEQHQHHPDIFLSYSTVRITLTTHDAGGLTQKDVALAKQIDTLLSAQT